MNKYSWNGCFSLKYFESCLSDLTLSPELRLCVKNLYHSSSFKVIFSWIYNNIWNCKISLRKLLVRRCPKVESRKKNIEFFLWLVILRPCLNLKLSHLSVSVEKLQTNKKRTEISKSRTLNINYGLEKTDEIFRF